MKNRFMKLMGSLSAILLGVVIAFSGIPGIEVLADELNSETVDRDHASVVSSYNGLEYNIASDASGDYAIITGLSDSTKTDLDIPAVIDGKPVKQIGHWAFRNQSGIQSISLPESITGIGRCAFAGCSNLERIDLPSHEPAMLIETLDERGRVFVGCTKLTEVNIPTEWETIPNRMFESSSITCVDLSACEEMTAVSADSFYDCEKLETVIFPKNVTRICRNAFAYCKSLQDITIPDSVNEIGYMAFAGCEKLTGVNLPSQEPEMIREVLDTHGRIFAGCSALSEITIPSGWESVPDNMFSDGEFTSVNLADGLKVIKANAFDRCTKLTELTIPESVEQIGAKAFYRCTGLMKIAMNDTCEISADAFAGVNDSVVVSVKKKAPSIPVLIENDFTMDYGKEYINPDSVLAEGGNSFTINREKITSGMSCTFSVSYSCIPELFENTSSRRLSDAKIIVYIPTSMNYTDGPVYIGSSIADGVTYDSDKRRLSIPVTKESGSIRIPLVAQGSGSVQSYALLSYKENDPSYKEGDILKSQIIDVLQVQSTSLSLSCAGKVSESALYVQGISNPGERITLFCNDTSAGEVKANQLGEYNTILTLPKEGTFKITAQLVGDPETKVSKYVTYDSSGTKVTKLIFNYHNHHNGWESVDLMSGSGKAIVTINPYDPVLFQIHFSDDSKLQSVFVVSTKNGVKKYLKATKTAGGEYVANGYFDPDDHGYILGQLSLQYYLKDTKSSNVGDLGDDPSREERSSQERKEWLREATGGEYDFTTVQITNKKTETRVAEDGNTETVYSGDFNFSSGRQIRAKVSQKTLTLQQSRLLRVEMVENPNNQYRFRYVNGKRIATRSSADGKHVEWISDTEDLENAPLEVFDIMIDGAGDLGDYLPVFDAAAEYLKHLRAALTGEDRDAHTKLLIEFGASQIADGLLDSLGKGADDIRKYAEAAYELIYGEDGQIQRTLEYIFDPSGYVYEAVCENRLQDVKASIYYKAHQSDGAGTLWNAADYGQENPLYTDRYGEYAWDVPNGFWQVKYERDGYDTAYSEWMEVPPIRTGVNIAMTSKAAPTVEKIYTDGATVTVMFSQYMKVSGLSDISVTDGSGRNYESTIQGEGLAKSITLNLREKAADNVSSLRVAIPQTAENYAGRSMAEAYLADVKVEALPSISDMDTVKLAYGEAKTVEVPIKNLTEGTAVEVESSDGVGLLATCDQNFDAQYGAVKICLNGNLPGTYEVKVQIKDTLIQSAIPVIVGEASEENGGDDPADDSDDGQPDSWLDPVETVSETEYILNLAAGQKYALPVIAKGKTDGKAYKIIETKADKAIASLSAKGLITAKKSGTAHIQVTRPGGEYTVTVNVRTPHFVYANEKEQFFTANAGDIITPVYDASNLRPTFSIPAAQQKNATVDPATGAVTAIRKGKVKVTAQIGVSDKSSGAASGKVTTTLRIYDPTLTGKDSVHCGKTIALKVKNGVKKTDWSVQNGTGSAAITAAGKLKGLTAGTVTVTAVNNGRTMTKEVAVTP